MPAHLTAALRQIPQVLLPVLTQIKPELLKVTQLYTAVGSTTHLYYAAPQPTCTTRMKFLKNHGLWTSLLLPLIYLQLATQSTAFEELCRVKTCSGTTSPGQFVEEKRCAMRFQCWDGHRHTCPEYATWRRYTCQECGETWKDPHCPADHENKYECPNPNPPPPAA
ncbi:hypothetical protein PSHT_12445 [Puccinia striiformis]|uniref:Uncharacterized protein n=1 Tax=Puccinia striiformis TaxID=27350 RepID=A0A2S4UWG7_9BASI|nr:hypothetical protein PSHT_12445 [Puccinia striiformis]